MAPLKFVFDKNVSKAVVEALTILEKSRIEAGEILLAHVADRYPFKTDDCVWLEDFGNEDYFVVTGDDHIRSRRDEVSVVAGAQIGLFILNEKERCRIIEQLMRSWRKMKECAKDERRPFAFSARKNLSGTLRKESLRKQR